MNFTQKQELRGSQFLGLTVSYYIILYDYLIIFSFRSIVSSTDKRHMAG